MRLTNRIRADLILAIMADVPQTDYKGLFQDAARKKIAALQKAAGLEGLDPVRLEYKSVEVYPKGCGYADRMSASAYGLTSAEIAPLMADPELTQIVLDNKAQTTARNELRTKLALKLNEFHTIEKLLAAAPEFKPYVPASAPKPPTPMLPACTDVLVDLAKVGWPKGKNPAAKKAPAKKAPAKRTAKKGTTP